MSFETEIPEFKLKNQRKIKRLLKAILYSHGYVYSNLAYLFTSDQKIVKINKEFLGHDYPTDIITFDYTVRNCVQADIVISVDTVRQNAIHLEEPFLRELHRVIIHGVLHLVGYNDKVDDEKVKMRGKENLYLENMPWLD
ncbi:MAG: rRNA maturation RNase YbeY [Bacteroidales bacterium]|nr:rRNA maturation RNase YbeY [Bacteroidales bacterium]